VAYVFGPPCRLLRIIKVSIKHYNTICRY